MLTGFKNAVEVDFTLEENKKKIENQVKKQQANRLMQKQVLFTR